MTAQTDKQKTPRAIWLRPSAAKRWTRCPAFPVLDQWNGDEKTESPWLLEGTFAHKLAEICLREDKRPGEFIRTEISCIVDEGTGFEREETFVPSEEMVGAVSAYLNVCDDVYRYVRRTDGVSSDPKIEDSVGFISNRISITGTADFLVASPKRIAIVDFKYGENVEVDAEENDQLIAYALGAANKYEPPLLEEILLVIVQPRLRTGGPTIKQWTINDAAAFVERETARIDAAVRRIVEQGVRGELEYNPSPSACQWCDSIKYCRGLWRYVEMIIENIGIDPVELDSDFVREILSNSKPIKDFVYAIERHSTTRALNGERFEGFKLVEGGRVPPRVWNDEKKVLRLLGKKVESGEVAEDKVFTSRSPLTPAQMEKVLGAEFVEKYSSRPSSDRPTILVPESDRRKAIATASDEFEDFLDGEDSLADFIGGTDEDDLDEFDI